MSGDRREYLPKTTTLVRCRKSSLYRQAIVEWNVVGRSVGRVARAPNFPSESPSGNTEDLQRDFSALSDRFSEDGVVRETGHLHWPLLKGREEIPRVCRLAFFQEDLSDNSVFWSTNGGEHLHGLDDDEFITFFDFVAGFDGDF